MTLRIFRVAVRGRFADLDDETRARLRAAADEHDVVSVGGFTDAGTLTYERSVDFFTFRVQLRSRDDDAEAAVTREARERAEAALAERGARARDVTVRATDMATMWR